MATIASATGRAAAILTTAEVFASSLDLTKTLDGSVTVELSFTLGSLTNMAVKFYGSTDGLTFFPLHSGVATLTETLTANATRHYLVKVPGVNFFAVSVTGSGTVTSSSCTITYRYQLPLVVSEQDGAPHLG